MYIHIIPKYMAFYPACQMALIFHLFEDFYFIGTPFQKNLHYAGFS